MKFRNIVKSIKENLMFYPVIYGVIAVAIAYLALFIDTYFIMRGIYVIPEPFLTDVDTGKTILSIISTSFITITTFTFSTTMVVLTMYNSFYTPRVVKNFLKQRETLQSFGIFVSGFLFTMIVFLHFSVYDKTSKIISPTIGLFYIAVGLFFFLRFVLSVVSHTQAGNLIARLKQNAVDEIGDYNSFVSGKSVLEGKISLDMYNKNTVYSVEDGYIQDVEYEILVKEALRDNIHIVFEAVVGDFVSKGDEIGSYYVSDNYSKDKKSIEKKMRNAILIGELRNEFNDFEFSMIKIVEVAMKGLSDAINDPNTAIHCTRILSLLLRDLSNIPDGYIMVSHGKDKSNDIESNAVVYIKSISFARIMNEIFSPLLVYSKSDAIVMSEIVKALYRALRDSSSPNKESCLFIINEIDDILNSGVYSANEMKILGNNFELLKSVF